MAPELSAETAFRAPLPAPLCEAARPLIRRLEAALTEAGQPLPPAPIGAELPALFACSEFVARSLIQAPQLLADLLAGDLERGYGASEYGDRLAALLVGLEDDDAELQLRLRRFRCREMVRIAWRELSGRASCEQTLHELSALADACVQQTLGRLYAWQCAGGAGTPRGPGGDAQRLIVLAMGKLGGGELNFSSDVDLVFVFPESGQTDGERPQDNGQFFTRLGQRLIRVLDEATAEGFVFRVDMRLRPFGDSGPLVVSIAALEAYLLNHGRDWERYAMIKARAIAGAEADTGELQALLRGFVYRRYLDYGAFESLREMKAKIAAEVARKGLADNIKIGPGGIREIEFIAQAFQLIRGGREPGLQVRPTLRVLGRLSSAKMLPGETAQELRAAYLLLRQVENRLQIFDDRQTHRLPSGDLARRRLAWSMGHADWAAFVAVLQAARDAVSRQFREVFNFAEPEARQPEDPLRELWLGRTEAAAAGARLQALGYTEGEAAAERLTQLRESRLVRSLSSTARQRLDALMPNLIRAAGVAPDPDLTLRRLLQLVNAVARRSVYLALLAEHPESLGQLVRLCAASAWISSYLTQHPILLDELLDERTLYTLPTLQSIAADLQPLGELVQPEDLETQMDWLRHFKQVHVLRIAAVDLASRLTLMKVSDHLTWLAEAILNQVTQLAWAQLTGKYGRPTCAREGARYHPGIGIVAYGKLGGIELGYGSDLDLVFLHDSDGDCQQTDGSKPIDNHVFFLRLSQKMIHFLNARTPAGELYEIDTRLRPNGASGLLVSSLEAYANYQREKAWTWEHQALVRARVVVGSEALRARFEDIRGEVLARRRDPAQLRAEVTEMRERMRGELGSRGDPQRFHLKQDRGGVADIEFMVQYEVLLHAHDRPALLEYTDNVRLLERLGDCGILDPRQAAMLADAYRCYRMRIHRLALQDDDALVFLDEELRSYRDQVSEVWQQLMEAP